MLLQLLKQSFKRWIKPVAKLIEKEARGDDAGADSTSAAGAGAGAGSGSGAGAGAAVRESDSDDNGIAYDKDANERQLEEEASSGARLNGPGRFSLPSYTIELTAMKSLFRTSAAGVALSLDDDTSLWRCAPAKRLALMQTLAREAEQRARDELQGALSDLQKCIELVSERDIDQKVRCLVPRALLLCGALLSVHVRA
jgi:hypothetical protein